VRHRCTRAARRAGLPSRRGRSWHRAGSARVQDGAAARTPSSPAHIRVTSRAVRPGPGCSGHGSDAASCAGRPAPPRSSPRSAAAGTARSSASADVRL
ncbi:MAG: hypothetical protein AVDCRST_MAG57-122, partial [uncultured Blastococcus sp.]